MDTGSPTPYNTDLTRDIRALGKLLFSFNHICIKIDREKEISYYSKP